MGLARSVSAGTRHLISFSDLIPSQRTPRRERLLAPHPSIKPQAFLRQVVRAALPLGQGIVLDPFAGSGSTLAAAEAVGYRSVGVELDADYAAVAAEGIPKLAQLHIEIGLRALPVPEGDIDAGTHTDGVTIASCSARRVSVTLLSRESEAGDTHDGRKRLCDVRAP